MATIPLPDLPPLADDALVEPTTQRNPMGLALPLLGALALSRGGGGQAGLLEGLAQGWQIGQQMRERQEANAERRRLFDEARAERKADVLRDLRLRAQRELDQIDDPVEHAERRSFWASVYRGAGGHPDEIEGITLPTTRVTRARQAEIDAAAREIVKDYDKQLANPATRDQILNATRRLPSGAAMTVRDLLMQSGHLQTTVERPIIEEQPAPEVTGTGRGLVRAGLPQPMITRREKREELLFPEEPKEPTVAIPNVGHVPLSVARALVGEKGLRDLLGISSPEDRQRTERDAQQRVVEVRTKDLSRLESLERSMRAATSEGQVRGGVQAANALITGIKQNAFKRTLMPEVTARSLFNERDEVLAWRQRQRAARGQGPAGPRVAPGGLVGHLVLRSQGLATGNPYIDRLSPQQAETLSRDPRLKSQNILDLILGGAGAGSSPGAALPSLPDAPSPSSGTALPAATVAPTGVPSRDAQDTLAWYRRTKQPILKTLWQTFSPEEQAWLQRHGVKVAP